MAVPRHDQFTSAVVIGELFAGAFLHPASRHIENLRKRVLPELTALPFDVAAAEEYGRIRAELQVSGKRIEDADLQIAATALSQGLSLVTGNIKHYDRIQGLQICRVLAESRVALSRK